MEDECLKRAVCLSLQGRLSARGAPRECDVHPLLGGDGVQRDCPRLFACNRKTCQRKAARERGGALQGFVRHLRIGVDDFAAAIRDALHCTVSERGVVNCGRMRDTEIALQREWQQWVGATGRGPRGVCCTKKPHSIKRLSGGCIGAHYLYRGTLRFRREDRILRRAIERGE